MQFRLNRWLYALCWTGTNRPSVLFDRAVAWLLANKVLLPGLTVLKRAVAQVRSRANERLWQRLTSAVSPEQRARLEALVVIPENERVSPLDRLRDGPVLHSPAELGRAVERLQEAQALAKDGVLSRPLYTCLPAADENCCSAKKPAVRLFAEVPECQSPGS